MTRESRRIRLWPGLLIVALQWLMWLVLPALFPVQEVQYAGVFAGFLGGIAVLLWWAFFSRAPRLERLAGALLLIGAMASTPRLLHESIASGMMGLMFFLYAVPPLSLAFVLWAALSRRLTGGLRQATMATAIFLACGAWALLRSDGIRSAGGADLKWRWSPTHEDRLLASASVAPAVIAPAPEPANPIDAAAIVEPQAAAEPATVAPERVAEEPAWPGFRGPNRDGVIAGVRIATDWSASPPAQLWRRPVGPGWSSFAVQGGLFYTQEQRGEDEIVACYDLDTGAPVWRHADATRFWEANAGPGPRATPTLHQGRVYAFGATGILNALDAESGKVLWSRDVAADAEKTIPGWGFASSPLIVGDTVFIAAAGKLAAYGLATGAPRWFGPDGGSSYSSPHLAAIGGVPQILLMSKSGIASFAPGGQALWRHDWPPKTRIVQPAVLADGGVLISAGESNGLRRLAVANGPDGWTAEERWTSFRLKPYFNDFVVHRGYAYGFDGAILACIDLEAGERKWKGGRYGQGQLLLLSGQDMLLVLSEDGELALVRAAPDGFTEMARFPAIQGKTWNHPALAGDVLLVRNGEEMAAFRLKLAGS